MSEVSSTPDSCSRGLEREEKGRAQVKVAQGGVDNDMHGSNSVKRHMNKHRGWADVT